LFGILYNAFRPQIVRRVRANLLTDDAQAPLNYVIYISDVGC